RPCIPQRRRSPLVLEAGARAGQSPGLASSGASLPISVRLLSGSGPRSFAPAAKAWPLTEPAHNELCNLGGFQHVHIVAAFTLDEVSICFGTDDTFQVFLPVPI